MTDNEKSLSDDELHEKHMHFFRSRSVSSGIVLGFVLIALLAGAAWRLHLFDGMVASPSSTPVNSTAVVVQMEQRIASLEQQTQTLDSRLRELDARIDKDASASVTSELPGGQQAASPNITVHMQNDLTTLSAKLESLQAQVKQNGSSNAQTQQAAQDTVSTAIAFTQLREIAATGRGFASELTSLRAVANNNKNLQEPLAQLDPYATKGAPTGNTLREEFMTLEPALGVATDKATASDWEHRLMADLRGFISVRPLHGTVGDAASDQFATVEAALENGDLTAALDATKKLPPEAQDVLKVWQAKVEARIAIDETMHVLADRLIAASMTTSAHTQGAP